MTTKETSAAASGGTSILGILGVLFVGLKLTGFITWSWWWVTAPFWGGLAVAVAAFLVAGLIAAIALLVA